jgi:hypothetical protein
MAPGPAIATPVDIKDDIELKAVKVDPVSQSQKLFVVDDGRSFEDQAGFFGRW